MEHETIRLFLRVIVGLLCITITLSVVSGFLFVRLNDSRSVVSCESFSSYAEAFQFVKEHPKYENTLDRNHNGMPCETAYNKL